MALEYCISSLLCLYSAGGHLALGRNLLADVTDDVLLLRMSLSDMIFSLSLPPSLSPPSPIQSDVPAFLQVHASETACQVLLRVLEHFSLAVSPMHMQVESDSNTRSLGNQN